MWVEEARTDVLACLVHDHDVPGVSKVKRWGQDKEELSAKVSIPWLVIGNRSRDMGWQ